MADQRNEGLIERALAEADRFVPGPEADLFGELADALLAAAKREERLVEALSSAASTFRHYERLHRAKGTEEGIAKAEANANHAADIEALIAEIQSKDKEEGRG